MYFYLFFSVFFFVSHLILSKFVSTFNLYFFFFFLLKHIYNDNKFVQCNSKQYFLNVVVVLLSLRFCVRPPPQSAECAAKSPLQSNLSKSSKKINICADLLLLLLYLALLRLDFSLSAVCVHFYLSFRKCITNRWGGRGSIV